MKRCMLVMLCVLHATLGVCAAEPDSVMPTFKGSLLPVAFQEQSLVIPQKIGTDYMVPFSTVFPTSGDRAISGNKMLASMGNYLREFRHYLYQNNPEQPFIFKQEGNVEAAEPSEEAVRHLMKQSPFFLGFIGTELMMSLEHRLKNNELMVLFPLEGLEELRAHRYPNVVYFRPSHTKELEALIAYAVKKRHKTSVGLLYEESLWGEKLLATSKRLLARYAEVKIVAEASYPQGTVEIEKALDTIAPEAPNVVLCLARTRPAYTFIRHALNKKLHDTLFLGMSELSAIQGILKTALGLDVVVTSVVPDPEQHADLPIIKTYKNNTESFLSFRADSPIYLEMFINLMLAETICKEVLAAGQLLTPGTLVRALEAIHERMFHGLTLSFNADDRSLSSMLWINPGIGQQWIAYHGGG